MKTGIEFQLWDSNDQIFQIVNDNGAIKPILWDTGEHERVQALLFNVRGQLTDLLEARNAGPVSHFDGVSSEDLIARIFALYRSFENVYPPIQFPIVWASNSQLFTATSDEFGQITHIVPEKPWICRVQRAHIEFSFPRWLLQSNGTFRRLFRREFSREWLLPLYRLKDLSTCECHLTEERTIKCSDLEALLQEYPTLFSSSSRISLRREVREVSNQPEKELGPDEFARLYKEVRAAQ